MTDRLCMSAGAVRNCTFEETIAATAGSGVDEIAVLFGQYRAHVAAGRDPKEMREIADRAGVRIVDIEGIFNVLVPDEDGRTAAFAERVFEAAVSLGAVRVGSHSDYDGDVDAAAERLGGWCDRAAEFGLSIGLEPVAVPGGLRDLDAGWAVIERTGRENVGLVLDTWHFSRGAGTIEMIQRIPGRAFRTVQISDGTLAPAPDLEYIRDTTTNRLPPGEGEFDLTAVIRALDAIGADVNWDMEILSTVLDALPPDEAARRAADTTRAVLAAARA